MSLNEKRKSVDGNTELKKKSFDLCAILVFASFELIGRRLLRRTFSAVGSLPLGVLNWVNVEGDLAVLSLSHIGLDHSVTL